MLIKFKADLSKQYYYSYKMAALLNSWVAKETLARIATCCWYLEQVIYCLLLMWVADQVRDYLREAIYFQVATQDAPKGTEGID